jgi:hypothetical protein
MWISSEKKYIEKSLRTKKKTDAIELAEELYIKLRNELANGKTLFAPTYEEAMQQYIANSLPTSNSVGSSSISAKDIGDMRTDFMQKQQALQPIKPLPSF